MIQQLAHRGQHQGNRKKELLTKEGKKVGDGRAERLAAIGDEGQAAISLTPDFDGTHVCIFERSQLEGKYIGDLLYPTSHYQSPS